MRAAAPRGALRLLAVGALAAGMVALAPDAPGGTGQADARRAAATPPRPVASRPTTAEAWTARVVVPVHPRRAPRARAPRVGLLTGAAPYNGNPEVLLVVGAVASARHGVWYRVLLNSRPNDATGWVPAAAVRVTRTPMRVTVRLSRRLAIVHRAGRPIARFRVAVGSRANPTPTGRFAISEVVPQRRPRGFYGSHIITLTAHSPRLNDFDGGDGRVALHGTNRPRLLGRAVSHGCVRFSNAAIRGIARLVPPGAPVDIIR